MKVVFLGVGEAADENFPCTSHLLLSQTKLLLDCGYSIPQQIWKYNSDKDFIDAVYISHLHADHYFGLPALLLRMLEEKRTKPITIICKAEFVKQIKQIIDFGYKNCQKAFSFSLNFLEIDAGKSIEFKELHFSFACTLHTVPNLAIRIENNGNSICYSGDGGITADSNELYEGCDLMIHEAYKLNGPINCHAAVNEVIAMSEKNKITHLALTHLQRSVRSSQMDLIREQIKKAKINVFVPDPLDAFCFIEKRFIQKH